MIEIRHRASGEVLRTLEADSLVGADLRDDILDGADLSGFRMQDAELEDCDLEGANLEGAILEALRRPSREPLTDGGATPPLASEEPPPPGHGDSRRDSQRLPD